MSEQPVFTELDKVTELYAISEKDNRQLKIKIHRLEQKLSGVSVDSPDAGEIQDLLDLWWCKVMDSNGNVAHTLSSTRAAKVRAALRRRKKIAEDQGLSAEWGLQMCRKAILGAVHDDWAMGRVAKSAGKKFNDIAEHILNTDGDIEKFAGLFDKHCSLITEEPYDEKTLKVIEGQKAKQARDVKRNVERWDRLERENPETAILAALDRVGCEWKPSGRDGWVAQCPAHEGTDLKLSIDWNGAGDRLLVKCWSRDCEVPYVMDALGLPLSALFKNAKVAA